MNQGILWGIILLVLIGILITATSRS